MKKIMMMAAMALFCIGVSAQCPDKKKKCDKPKTEQCCKKKKGDCCKKKSGEKKGDGCKKKCQSECGNPPRAAAPPGGVCLPHAGILKTAADVCSFKQLSLSLLP